MITGINLNETIDYIIKADKENPTIWKLGILPSYVMTMLLTDRDVSIGEKMIDTVKFGLKGWDNFKINGKEVIAKKEPRKIGDMTFQVLTSESISVIPVNVINELSNEIVKVNSITKEEEKN